MGHFGMEASATSLSGTFVPASFPEGTQPNHSASASATAGLVVNENPSVPLAPPILSSGSSAARR